MLDVSPTQYMAAFDRVNVCPFPKASTIVPKEWTAAAENLAGSLLRNRRVILLGSNVVECFGMPRSTYEYLEWKEKRPGKAVGVAGFRAGRMGLPFSWAVLPHPSGRNRWYNDPENVVKAKMFLRTEMRRSEDSLEEVW